VRVRRIDLRPAAEDAVGDSCENSSMTTPAAALNRRRSTHRACGPEIVIREVRRGDDAAIAHLLGGLDLGSRYQRWFTGGVDVVAEEEWAAHPERCCAVGLLAFAGAEPVGHAVLIPIPDGRGEVAFEVAAPWRRHGIAGALLERLLAAAAERGLHEVYADVLSGNADMLAVMREHGPHSESCDGSVTTVALPVTAVAQRAGGPASSA
jgi:GNAT superfamily N-acetyltransferase